MKVRVDFVKEVLVKEERARRDVTLQLIATATCLKIREHKVSHRRQTKVVGIDVDYPAVPELTKA